VVISAPAGDDVPAFVFGVIEMSLDPRDRSFRYGPQNRSPRIISTSSATTNCLAPVAKALHSLAPIRSGIVIAVHAYTAGQPPVDRPVETPGGFRRSRAGAINIVPAATGAATAIGQVIPELRGKLTGAAQRVPVASGSSAILIAVVKAKHLDAETVNNAMKAKAASNRAFGYNEEEIVSSDITGTGRGSIFDATQTLVSPIQETPLRETPVGETPIQEAPQGDDAENLWQVQVVAWYDNESSYASQMVRTIKYFAALGPVQGRAQNPGPKPTVAKPPITQKSVIAAKPAVAQKSVPAAKPPAAQTSVPAAKPAAAKSPAAKPATEKAPGDKPAPKKPAADKNRAAPMHRKPLIHFPK
jgi:glyceraldehyde-3-phosphate dehydrogenase type I